MSVSAQSVRRAVPSRGARTVSHLRFLAIELVLAAIIIALSLFVHRNPGPLPGDVGFELDVQHWLLPAHALTQAVEAVSTLNWPVPAAITLAVIVAAFLLLRRWLDIIILLATAAVVDETSYIFNQWVHRPRPHGYGIVNLSVLKTTYSFPSGHVIHAVAVFGLLLFLSTQIRRPLHPALIWAIRVVLVAAILLMPISRILEGEHWPSDTVAGALYGAFFLIIATHLFLWARGRWPVLLARDER